MLIERQPMAMAGATRDGDEHSMHAETDASRARALRARLARKPALRRFYLEVYDKYRSCLSRCPREGIAIEVGSGVGFAKEVIAELVTSDVVPYPWLDRIVDARAMPFEGETLRAIFLLNVLHHVTDAERFFDEAQRCLVPGGRLLIIDQYRGWISTPILRYAHREGFDPDAADWKFDSAGHASGANGALPWIVFERDRTRFDRGFPALRVVRMEPHSPLRYWLAGGLRRWSLLPGWAFPSASRLDRALLRLSPRLASFVDIELVKT
jgi:SAM-dependent methyltransferase